MHNNNLTTALFELNADRADKIAYRDNDTQITYGELEIKVRKVAAWIASCNVNAHDRVAIAMTDKIDTVVVILSTILIGAVAVLVNPRGNKENINHQIKLIEPALIVTDEVVLQEHAPYTQTPNTQLTDVAFMLWTSGTSGHSKAVMHTHRNALEMGKRFCQTIGITAQDRVFSPAKLFSSYGFVNKFCTILCAGAECRLDAELSVPYRIKKILQDYQPTLFFSNSYIYGKLLDNNTPVPPGTKCFSSGDKLSQLILDTWQAKNNRAIYNIYGSTECLGIAYNPCGTKSIGQTVVGYTVKIVDDVGNEIVDNKIGQLVVQASSVAVGYYKDVAYSEKTFGKEWIQTGDLAHRDEAGEIHLTGRTSDVIKIHGLYTNLGELEDVIKTYNGVDRVAVVSYLNKYDNTEIAAFVVPSHNTELDVAQLRKWLRTHYEKQKCPQRIYVVSELPLTDTDKIQKYKLEKEIYDREETQSLSRST